MRTSSWLASCLAVFLAAGCSDSGGRAPKGIPSLGGTAHSIDAVTVTIIGTAADKLKGPRDLDWNPYTPGELWVVNRTDDSVVRFSNAGTDAQTSVRRQDSYALHFMEEVAAISFAQDQTFQNGNTFGTCQESDNTYNHQEKGNFFMGPTLWTSDWTIFGFPNPQAVEDIGFDLGSHIDMMHESPFCMGIGWERNNIYWTMDGATSTISRYDFAQDHGVGYDDHSGGSVWRYLDVPFARVPDVPSHIVYDHASDTVFFANTGGAQLVRFDPTGATQAQDESSHSQDHGEFLLMTGGTATVLAEGEAAGLVQPSGIALHGEHIYVSDNANGRISAFDKKGKLVDYLETGLPAGALMGIRVDADGNVWATNFTGNQVLRYSPAPVATP